ncbi:conserved hypothetical protein [Histoplasma capsulatum G186AR]|uniref:Carnitinyl-CoA dehydratase n=2 Tax=Ajellomyces capsulatus TaxID=5037 RepID=C0NT58_AJECG|nr:uncharacterized protein HCBG_06338 [Histoplasma capsulatum G186AR]EEH05219.1 conserved hypothetical protein [Histoplasma capsulatum G186AR]KAG5305417.1 enoyl-CoA hydratase [Histoplasma capsulatum]QSS76379.1 enoyl-CoA hydratase [Histoplasma capsulatum G186AR]
MPSPFTTPPPQSSIYLLSYPTPGVLLVTINRARHMNAIHYQGHWDFHALWTWFDDEHTLQIGIVTGAGDKAFCAGQDLLEIEIEIKVETERNNSKIPPAQQQPATLRVHPPSGFAGLSQRKGKKPVIAAVNGFAFGGGFEICLNCDLVIASPKAQFALPEAKRGIYAAAGGLPRITHIAGLQVASEIALTGRAISAEEARAWHLVNRISKTHESLMGEALALAREISQLSPDAIIVTRAGLREAWEVGDVSKAVRNTSERYSRNLFEGRNLREGLAAFREKRQPHWVKPNL